MAVENTDELRATLAAQYEIERELGRGGMATVYLARDLRHERLVALKVLRPDVGAALGRERFTREIKLAAGLQHPHIVSVHDSGTTPSGQLWFTMPYVDGLSLRDRLRQQRQLSVDESVRITREVAHALDYAHRHGVIHRDIKPENVLLLDGQALVADFGIARAFSSVASGETLTATGVAIGTPAYMSPEQAAGERALDPTTDVYSLGAVCYEMLAGEPPFPGPTAQAIAAKMRSGDVPSIRRVRPSVPEAVEDVVRKALAPVPADRYATAEGFAKALESAERTVLVSGSRAAARITRSKWPVAIASLAAFVVLVGAFLLWRARNETAATPMGAVRIAVLPFDNLGDTSDAYFADGITDAVRGKLTAVSGLEVTAPVTSLRYRHTAKTPQEVGRELGVRYLLIGRVRWAKSSNGTSRVEVNPALIDAESAADKWEAPFDAPLTDVFQVQADIATRVADALQVALTSADRKAIARQPTSNLAAYNAYLRGLSLEQFNSALYYESASRAYAQAVATDSSFALAWARLAFVKLFAIEIGDTPQLDEEVARTAAARAVAIAPDLPEAHAAQGFYYAQVPLDPVRALAEYDIGRRLSPGDPTLLSLASLVEWGLGNRDSSLVHREKAALLDPQNANVLLILCDGYRGMFRYADAQRACDRALALAPRRMELLEARVFVSLEQGDLVGARGAIRDAITGADSSTVADYISQEYEIGWLLDATMRRRALRDCKALGWFDCMLEQATYLHDPGLAHLADSARRLVERQQQKGRRSPVLASDAFLHMDFAVALTYLGPRYTDSAAAEIERGDSIISGHAYESYVRYQGAKSYVRLGRFDDALSLLEKVVSPPNLQEGDRLLEPFYTRAYMRLDPNLDPLHGNPRFEKLMATPTRGAQ